MGSDPILLQPQALLTNNWGHIKISRTKLGGTGKSVLHGRARELSSGRGYSRVVIANRIRMNTIETHYKIEMTVDFAGWLDHLQDRPTKIRLVRRLERASRGLLGGCRQIGNGLFEMREFFGPGWRLYYIYRDKRILFFLHGGDKGSQSADIAKARLIAEKLLGGGKHD